MHHHPHTRLRELDQYTLRQSIRETARLARSLDSAPPPLAPTPLGRPGRTIDLKPLAFDARSANELRPATFEQMIGQERLKALMRRIVNVAQQTGRPLEHMLLSGQSGTGKTTLAQVVAHESGRRVFQIKAPVGFDVLDALREACRDGDVVIIDEIHQQVQGDRRGITQACDPEDFYHVMEDRRLPTPGGMVAFPAVTFVGCTTDSGLLPEAFIGRFPLRPTLDPYTDLEMAKLARANAQQLGIGITNEAAVIFGCASRQNPRQLNDYVKNARSLAVGDIGSALATEVVVDLNGCTHDGLTPDMQRMLRFLLSSRRASKDGTVVYQASINTIATALGKSRDTKVVALYVEPWLISRGFVQVCHGGRQLTDAGIARAKDLT